MTIFHPFPAARAINSRMVSIRTNGLGILIASKTIFFTFWVGLVNKAVNSNRAAMLTLVLVCSPLRTYLRTWKSSNMAGDTSQAKESTLTFQCLILTSTNYTIWRMHMKVLLGIHRVWDVVDPGSDDAKKNNIVEGLLF
ncbi:uncharacterized mitochondrial protein-like protein [Tanacetum coccineum]